ncbi:hypothetical protein EOM81_09920 [bacterium]|nr:hypothetical protein [bacterium]
MFLEKDEAEAVLKLLGGLCLPDILFYVANIEEALKAKKVIAGLETVIRQSVVEKRMVDKAAAKKRAIRLVFEEIKSVKEGGKS